MNRILKVDKLSNEKWIETQPKLLKQALLECEQSPRISKYFEHLSLKGIMINCL